MLPLRGIGPMPTYFEAPLPQNMPPRGEHTDIRRERRLSLIKQQSVTRRAAKRMRSCIYTAGHERNFGGMASELRVRQAESEVTKIFTQLCRTLQQIFVVM